MASILDRYGIKEVADVTFYNIDEETGAPSTPALYCDTLKVSTIEQTGEETDSRGGKGNAILLSWDYNKEINVTIEDALFSAKSMAIMFGGGLPANYPVIDEETYGYIMKTEQFVATSTTTATALQSAVAATAGWNPKFRAPDGKEYTKVNPKFYTDKNVVATDITSGETYFCSYDLKMAGSVIEISANSFPGTYYVTGDTFARSQKSGKDEFFQFIIPKAKVTSENTITLEAEGDPSTFSMNLKVLRPDDGIMMKLVQYDLLDGTEGANAATSVYHNHILTTDNMSDLDDDDDGGVTGS